MTNKLYRVLIFILALSASSCKKDYLDRTPLNIISDKSVFADEGLTTAYLYTIYNYMPCGYGAYYTGGTSLTGGTLNTNGGFGITDLLDGSTDLLRSPSVWNESNSIMIPGLISATYNPMETWGRSYQVIRKVNNMLFYLSTSSLSQSFKDRVTAEARFVRAFQYFDLARRYGDVPLITKLQSFDNIDSLMVSRTPVAQVYDYVGNELTAIADQLPSVADLAAAELGRVTREAAWALNGRNLLYAKNYARSAEFSKKVMDASLYQLNSSYANLFQSHGGDKEVIFEVLFDGVNKGHCYDALMLPHAFVTGWGAQTNPTQELVDSYEMTNGKYITDNGSGYDDQNPFANRDQRFYASILYNGATLKGKALSMVYPDGTDAPLQPDRTITGYYPRKFIDESAASGVAFGESKTSWKELRLAEVLLNYAEAENEAAGPSSDVYAAIQQVRDRAGQPALPAGLTKDEMFARIVQERKIELAFEGFRFWDLRRWNMAESVLNGKYFHGMMITKDAGSGNLVYTPYEVSYIPKQVFLPKHYLMPIPQTEIEKNTNLAQNTGY